MGLRELQNKTVGLFEVGKANIDLGQRSEQPLAAARLDEFLTLIYE